ncbi:MAG: tetratricopeptide repeat protein [Calditrichaeota bacterium]|nr:MAG: tetratricopeptide repeat protein [Calditrichota bacterium]
MKPNRGTQKGGGKQAAIRAALRQAREAIETGRLERAAALLAEALNLSPDHPLLLTRLADVHLRQGNPTRALELLQSVLESHPDFPYARYLRGRVLEQLRRWKQAEADYRAILARRPADRFALVRLVDLLIRRGRLDEAEQWIAQARQRFGDPNLLFVQEMALQAARGQRLEVAGKIRRYLQQADHLSRQDFLALLRLLARVEARPIARLIEELRQTNPHLPELVPDRVGILAVEQMRRRGRQTEALAQLEALLARHPEDRFLQKQKGLLLARMGRLPQALEVLEPLFLDNPQDLFLRATLEKLYRQSGRTDRWRQLLREALRRHPTETALFGLLRKAHYQRDWLADLNLTHPAFLSQVRALGLPERPFPPSGWQKLPLYALEAIITLLVRTGRLPAVEQVWAFCVALRKSRGGPGFRQTDLEAAYPAWLFGLQFYFLFAGLARHPRRFVPARFQRQWIAFSVAGPAGELAVDVSAWFNPEQRIRKLVVKSSSGFRWRLQPTAPAAHRISGIPFYSPAQARQWLAALQAAWPPADQWF